MSVLSKQKNARSSNLELFRIITMLSIVAHHYVVNSDLLTLIYTNHSFTLKNIFLLVFGAWGKVGINCFVLITGYFMCKSNITGIKYFKLLFEVMFYKIVIFLIFFLCGKESLSLTSLINTFLPTTSVSSGFTDCFLLFYLLIPFINLLIQQLSKKKHIILIVLMLFIYSVMGSIPWFNVSFNYISWFFVLYLIASFIRLYPDSLPQKNIFWGVALLVSIIVSVLSILVIYSGKAIIISHDNPYYFLSDSNKIFAVAISVSAFVFFKNLELPHLSFINIIGATTYGVLLIHSNSEAMRRWLWDDLLRNISYYDTTQLYLHATISVVLVFFVCSFIDFIRIKAIETPALKLYAKLSLKKKA